MEHGNLIHHATPLPFYHSPIISSAPLLPPTPPGAVGLQDSMATRSALAGSGQNGWGCHSHNPYQNDSPANASGQPSCAGAPTSPYSNCALQLAAGASFAAAAAASGKVYNGFGANDYFHNCRQSIGHFGSTLNNIRSYQPGFYSDGFYNSAAAVSGHTAGYGNGAFYGDMTSGFQHLASRDALTCSSNVSELSSHGK